MEQIRCSSCGKKPLNKDEIGLTKKLLGRDSSQFLCLICLAEYFEVDPDFMLAKIEEFKEQGCTLF